MPVESQCKALTRAGARCANTAKTAGFCGVHLPKPKKSSIASTAKTIAEVTAAVGGIVGIVEKLVQLWQSLPFGPGPEMPNDYEYLAEEVGPSWGSSPSTYTPINRSGATVNWSLARTIYDRANAFLVEPPGTPRDQGRDLSLLDMDAEELINSLPPELQRLLLQQLGSTE
jgi:hypothetical protein